jgi:hypothetical protein
VTLGKSPDLGYLLSLWFIVVRHLLGGPSLFRTEIIGEDLLLLLILALWLAPPKFNRTISRMISFTMCATLALFTWTTPARTFTLAKAIFYTALLALLAIHSAVLAVRELSKLGKQPNGTQSTRPEPSQ